MDRTKPTDRSVATRVVVSYRLVETDDEGWMAVDSAWTREAVEKSAYRTYLKRAHGGPVAVGDEFEEFVNCGCASPRDVVLRIEAIVGGTDLGMETDIELRPRQRADESYGRL